MFAFVGTLDRKKYINLPADTSFRPSWRSWHWYRSCSMKFCQVERRVPSYGVWDKLSWSVFCIMIVTDLWKHLVAHQSAMSHVSMTMFMGANAPMRNPQISKEATLLRERVCNFHPFGHLHVVWCGISSYNFKILEMRAHICLSDESKALPINYLRIAMHIYIFE